MPQMRSTDRQLPMPELRVPGDAGHKRNGTVEEEQPLVSLLPDTYEVK